MNLRHLTRRFIRYNSEITIDSLRATLPIGDENSSARSIDGLHAVQPSENILRARIPLSDRSFVQRLKYRQFDETIRTGRILEDFDYMAAAAAYKHNQQLASEDGQIPLTIVTAMVDEIRFYPKFHSHSSREDLIITGQVCWVGRSSMDVLCTVENEQGDTLSQTHFIMVARCPTTNRAAPVIQVNPATEEEMKNYEHSEYLSKERKLFASQNIFNVMPATAELEAVHELFKTTTNESFSDRNLPENAIAMNQAEVKSVIVCQPESRNIHNKIFGGWLMRQATELARSNACMVTGGIHRIIFIDDIMFDKPVEIGSILMLHSQIIYSENNRFQVRVRVEKRTHGSMMSEGVVTNVLNFTFEADEAVPVIMPKTYGEAMLYLTGQRHFNVQENAE